MKRRGRGACGRGRGYGCVVLFGSHVSSGAGTVLAAAVEPALELRVGPRAGWGCTPGEVEDREFRHSIERAAEAVGLSTRGLAVGTRSLFPAQEGPWGPAALCVALVRALADFGKRDFADQDVFETAREVGAVLYGSVSPVEAALATWGGVIAFRNGLPVRRVSPATPLPLLVSMPAPGAGEACRRTGATGSSRISPCDGDLTHAAMERATSEGERALELGDLEKTGWLLTANHRLLQEMSLSSAALDAAVDAAHVRGALGARASRSEGGSVVVSLADGQQEALALALRTAGTPTHTVVVATPGVSTRPRAGSPAVSATA